MTTDLTIGEVAKYLGVSKATVRRATERGELYCWKTPGGHKRYRDADVRQFRGDHMEAIEDVPSSFGGILR